MMLLDERQVELVKSVCKKKNYPQSFVRRLKELPDTSIYSVYRERVKDLDINFRRKIHYLLTGKLFGRCKQCNTKTTWMDGKYNKFCSQICSGASRQVKCICVKCSEEYMAGDKKGEMCPSCKEFILEKCSCGCGGFIRTRRWKFKNKTALVTGHWMKGRSYKEIYGTSKVKCGFKKGRENLSQDPRIMEKILHARYRRKIYTTRLGKTFRVQGYEDLVLKALETAGKPVDKLTNRLFNYPVIRYKDGGTQRRYFPDFFNPNTETFYEVKSIYTLCGSRQMYYNLQLKANAVVNKGYRFKLYLARPRAVKNVDVADLALPYKQFKNLYCEGRENG